MKFGAVSLDQAEGAILAHSVTLSTGKVPKGVRLDHATLGRMAQDGLDQVVVAQLGPGDLHEDEAATRIGAALIAGASNVRLTAAGHGRVNIIAQGPGVACLDVPKIEAANRIDPGITVATVPPWRRLADGGLVATVKIIPYGVPEDAVDTACSQGQGGVSLHQPVLGRALLIETRIGPDAPAPKGRAAIEMRLDRLGVALAPRCVVPHEAESVAAALVDHSADLVLILTGSATSDVADTAPSAVVAAGGRIDHYGMPVDPGNLLFLGTLGATPVVGLPGCARSVALNGADWVLERLICGVPVTSDMIMGMGVGGLLKETPERGMRRRPTSD